MNVLFGEQNFSVDYASDAAIPENALGVFNVHHESIFLEEMQQIIESIGGKTTGEHMQHSDGTSIDFHQFEAEEKEEKNV